MSANTTNKANYISWGRQLEIVSKHLNLWVVYVNAQAEEAWEDGPINTALQALREKYSEEIFTQSVINGNLVTFDNGDEAQDYYNNFAEIPLESSCVYAAIISPVDGFTNENT